MGNEQAALASFTWKGPATKLCSKLPDRPSCFSLPAEQLQGASQWGIKVKLLSKPAQYESSSKDRSEFENQIIKWEANAHEDIQCEACGEIPIRGRRYMCTKCPSYNLCSSCYLENQEYEHHMFLVIPNGKTSRKLRNHLEDPAFRQSNVYGAVCDACYHRIGGDIYYQCSDCYNYDLCGSCYLEKGIHSHHLFVLARTPADDKVRMVPEAVKSLIAKEVVYDFRRP